MTRGMVNWKLTISQQKMKQRDTTKPYSKGTLRIVGIIMPRESDDISSPSHDAHIKKLREQAQKEESN